MGSVSSPTLFFFFQDSCGYSGSLEFLHELWDELVNFYKEVISSDFAREYVKFVLFLIKKFFLVNYFFATLGLCCCTRAFSSCSEQRPLLVAVHGLLIAEASLVVGQGL